MSISITPKGHTASILRQLSTACKVDKRGGISWSSRELEHNLFSLIASLQFEPKVDDHDKDAAIWKTLNACAKAQTFSVSFFVRDLRNSLNLIESGAVKSYVVAAQLNVATDAPLSRSLASFSGPVAVAKSMKQWEAKVIHAKSPGDRERLHIEDGFLFLRRTIRARNDRAAIDLGYRDLQFTVGLLNLVSHGYGLSHRSGMPDVPLGRLLLASSTQLIKPEGRTVGDWLVPSQFPHKYRLSFSARSTNIGQLAPYTRKWVSRIKATDFPERLTSAVIQFQEAISANQIDTTLIKLWTCIELLCARPDQKEPHDRVIKRAASIFSDPSMSNLRLEFIANSRHSVVHRGDDGNHALLCAQWASIYAAGLIRFCAFNRHNLRRHADILDYLSVPRSAERIRSVIKVHQLKLKSMKTKRAKRDDATV